MYNDNYTIYIGLLIIDPAPEEGLGVKNHCYLELFGSFLESLRNSIHDIDAFLKSGVDYSG